MEYDVLDAAGSKMAALTPEELQNLTDEGSDYNTHTVVDVVVDVLLLCC